MSALQHVDVRHSKLPVNADTTEYIPMRRLDHKTVWSPLFFEIFSEVRAQEVSPKR